jgi:hypothetical protein
MAVLRTAKNIVIPIGCSSPRDIISERIYSSASNPSMQTAVPQNGNLVSQALQDCRSAASVEVRGLMARLRVALRGE